MSPKFWKWLKTTLIACLGGGCTAALAAAFDPQKYNWRHDIGSGKLWEFFAEGALLMFAGLLIRSPLGQQVLSAYKQSQVGLEDSKSLIESTKAEIKSGPPAAH